MVFTQRQKAILLYLNGRLSKPEEAVSGRQIAARLQISLRTLQNEISRINRECARPVIRSSNKGYFLDSLAFEELCLPQESGEKEGEDLFRFLLFQQSPCDIDELADLFYLSTSAMQRRLKKMDERLGPYEMHVARSKNRVYIEGTEFQKRRMIRDMVMRQIGRSGSCMSTVASYFPELDTAGVACQLLTVITKCGYEIESGCTINLVVSVITAVSRAAFRKPGKRFSLPEGEVHPFEEEKEVPEFCVAKSFCREIAKEFAIPFEEEDVREISRLLMGQILPEKGQAAAVEEGTGEEKRLESLVRQTLRVYGLKVSDETMLPAFIRQLAQLLKRAKNRQDLVNVITGDLREMSPFVFDVALHLTESLTDAYGVRISEDETELLAVSLGFLIGRSELGCEPAGVLLVCDSFGEMAARLEKNLKEFHGREINFLGTVSTPEEVPFYENVDLVVHTLPAQTFGRAEVFVSPFFTEEDRRKVSAALLTVAERRAQRENRQLLLRYFSRDRYYRNRGIRNGEDAIAFLGRQAETCGLCPAGYTQSVKKRESVSSTRYRDSFAVPHAFDFSANQTFVSVLAEENGIWWNGSRIPFVCLIGVSYKDREKFMTIYNSTIRFLLHGDMAAELAGAANYDSFLSCLDRAS